MLVDGQDVTGVPVRERNVAMVYQQFINYPSLTVVENIASPLQAARREEHRRSGCASWPRSCTSACSSTACPAELSGGQQQRMALARALAKGAALMLLDEPLVNLDYKLREELRDELQRAVCRPATTVVYATTEPREALQLGGYTAVLDAGELLQYGPTAEVFPAPQSLRVARAFSDPPMNLLAGGAAEAGGVQLERRADAAARRCRRAASEGALTDRPARQRAAASTAARGRHGAAGQVELAEISGSETFVHVRRRSASWWRS